VSFTETPPGYTLTLGMYAKRYMDPPNTLYIAIVVDVQLTKIVFQPNFLTSVYRTSILSCFIVLDIFLKHLHDVKERSESQAQF
jgi:hypothetical protein